MKFRIVTDSTCDLSREYLEENQISFCPLKVIFGNTQYDDKIGITNAEFFKKLKESAQLPSTSQVGPGEFYEVFEKILNEDPEAVILVPLLSSKLSGTYASAEIAKNMLETDRIHIMDSCSASLALGSMLMHMVEDIKAGKDLETIISSFRKRVTSSKLYAVLDTLENLRKGGRLSATKAIIGGILGVKPIITVDDGLVTFKEKVRKFDKGLDYLVDQLRNDFPDKKIPYLSIGSTNSPANLEKLKEKLRDEFLIEKMEEFEIGSVIGVHTSEGAVAIQYFV